MFLFSTRVGNSPVCLRLFTPLVAMLFFPAQGYCGQEAMGVFSHTGRGLASVPAAVFLSGGYVVLPAQGFCGEETFVVFLPQYLAAVYFLLRWLCCFFRHKASPRRNYGWCFSTWAGNSPVCLAAVFSSGGYGVRPAQVWAFVLSMWVGNSSVCLGVLCVFFFSWVGARHVLGCCVPLRLLWWKL